MFFLAVQCGSFVKQNFREEIDRMSIKSNKWKWQSPEKPWMAHVFLTAQCGSFVKQNFREEIDRMSISSP